MSHTKGPWVALLTGYTGRASAKYVVTPEDSTRAVAHIKHSTISPMEENARLIAASPCLLEACQTALQCIRKGLPITAETLNGLVLARLEFAVSKATNASPTNS